MIGKNIPIGIYNPIVIQFIMLPEIDDIKIKRNLNNLKQKELAKLSGVSQSTIAKIESNKTEPSYKIAKKIFETLDKIKAEKLPAIKAKEIHSKKIIKIFYNDTVLKASEAMDTNNFSQLPVYKDNNVVGSISEKIFKNYFKEETDYQKFSKLEISKVMESPFPQVDENITVKAIIPLLDYSKAVITTRKGKVVGIITDADLRKLLR